MVKMIKCSNQILPRDGEIIFGSDATLAFTNEADHSASCLSDGSGLLKYSILSDIFNLLVKLFHWFCFIAI